MTLSITQAWNETAAFVAREGRLLFPLAFTFTALPGAIMQLIMPPPSAPGQLPEGGTWLLLLPVVVAATMIGNIAVNFMALRPGVSVQEAIGRGARRFLPLLAALLLVALAISVALFILAIIVVALVPGAMSSSSAGIENPAMAMAALLVMLLFLPLMLYLGSRLIALTPAAANEDLGPINLLRHSWQLTAGHVLKLIGFLLLVAIVLLALSLAIQAVAGSLAILLAGPVRPFSLSAVLLVIVQALINTVLGVYLAVLIARVYAQLAAIKA